MNDDSKMSEHRLDPLHLLTTRFTTPVTEEELVHNIIIITRYGSTLYIGIA